MKQETARMLRKKQNQIIDLWMQNQLGEDGLREDLMSNEELRVQSEELVVAILKSIGTGDNVDAESPQYEQVYDILSNISVLRARQGFSAKETGVYIFSLKNAIITVLQQELKADAEALLQAVLNINRLIDAFGVVTFETFIKGREEVIQRQTNEITDISTPVIRVWDDILALPIIGTLDSQRTQVVMENLLTEIVATGSSIAILDISGVPAVDSLVAQHLIKTVSATRLMGAECIISGIRPEIAQTIVHLGIDLSNIVTKSSLASALKYSFRLLQMEVRRKPAGGQTIQKSA